VILPPATFEETAVDDVLGQRVLEAVRQLGFVSRREDEIQAVETLEVLDHCPRSDRDDT
jgi:hypothetical protein